MLGAIIGDIVGSVYEFNPKKQQTFLFIYFISELKEYFVSKSV